MGRRVSFLTELIMGGLGVERTKELTEIGPQ